MACLLLALQNNVPTFFPATFWYPNNLEYMLGHEHNSVKNRPTVSDTGDTRGHVVKYV